MTVLSRVVRGALSQMAFQSGVAPRLTLLGSKKQMPSTQEKRESRPPILS